MAVQVRQTDLLRNRIDRFTRMVPAMEKGDIKSLHRVRVASRRLREIVPILQVDPDATRKLARRLRKVTRRLGAVRELDVMLLLIDELHDSRPSHQAALRRVGVGVGRTRNLARKRLPVRLPPSDLTRIGRKLSQVLDELNRKEESRGAHARKSARWAIDARIANRAARLAEAVKAAGAMYLPERLHAVRIAVKKLRYTLELAADTRREKNPPALRTLKRAQTLLGRMHDLQILIERVRETQASLTPPSLPVWRELDELVVTLEDMCRRLHARYVRERDAVDEVARKLAAVAPAPTRRAEQRAG